MPPKIIDGKKYYADVQEILCKRYNVTLSDYLTPKERRKLAWSNRWTKFKEILGKMKLALDNQHKENQTRRSKKTTKRKGINLNDISMSEKDYKAITGRTTDQDLSFITSRGKKPKMSYITGPSRKTDYSSLVGKGSRKDYSSLIGKRKKINL